MQRHTHGQPICERVLNVTDHWGNQTTMKYPLTLVRIAIIKNTKYKCGQGYGETGILSVHYE